MHDYKSYFSSLWATLSLKSVMLMVVNDRWCPAIYSSSVSIIMSVAFGRLHAEVHLVKATLRQVLISMQLDMQPSDMWRLGVCSSA